jgi:hypothetical protein
MCRACGHEHLVDARSGKIGPCPICGAACPEFRAVGERKKKKSATPTDDGLEGIRVTAIELAARVHEVGRLAAALVLSVDKIRRGEPLTEREREILIHPPEASLEELSWAHPLGRAFRMGTTGRAASVPGLSNGKPRVFHSNSLTEYQGVAREVQASEPGPKVIQMDHGTVGGLEGGERRILVALQAHHPRGRSRVQLGIATLYNHKGGRFGNLLGALKGAGYIDGNSSHYVLTPEGLALLSHADIAEHSRLPGMGYPLLQAWVGKLEKSRRLILMALFAEASLGGMSKVDLAAKCKYEATGGAFGNGIGELRGLGLIKGKNARLYLSEDLFQ